MSQGSAPVLHVCGLGPRPPHETSLETLQAIAACRVVYSDLSAGAERRWLKSWCRELRRPSGPAEVVAELKRGGAVGLAVWGHPQLNSALARGAAARAAAAGLAVRTYGAISPFSSAMARRSGFFGDDFGLGGLNALSVGTFLSAKEPPDPDMPLILFGEPGKPARWRQALARLRGRRIWPCPSKSVILVDPRE